ncbi:MAG: 2-C-methyl-D-erythritol 4-phosphate cytidylyltransferase [Nitrospirota bacterium]
MQKQKKVIAIVPAAGLGRRFGTGTNKPFQELDGKPLIVWSLDVLASVSQIDEIIPVFKRDEMEFGRGLIEEYCLQKIQRIAPGGKERQDSVFSGLRLIEDRESVILIHDGVRPCIDRNLVERVLGALQDGDIPCDGVIPGVPAKDTIKEAAEGIVTKTLRRSSLWAIQTPQAFPYESVMRAYERAGKEGFYSTDDAALVERNGGILRVVKGSYKNIKITTPEDLIIAEAFIKCGSAGCRD